MYVITHMISVLEITTRFAESFQMAFKALRMSLSLSKVCITQTHVTHVGRWWNKEQTTLIITKPDRTKKKSDPSIQCRFNRLDQ